jgi:exonuclease-1
MGIKGLPEVLKPYLIPVEVSRHRGKRAAVDAYSWLHKGMYGCAYDLGVKNHYWKQQRRDPPYVRYCVHRAQMLRHFGVTPVIVFDGDRLPAKGGEEKERRDRRAECMRKGHEKMAVGDKDGAAFFFAQGLDVTPAMAHELIAALKREGFEFVVAPYEADAQIAALAQLGGGEKGGVDVVFTEDSDLVAYGCPTVLFKLDKHGAAMELNVADVLAGPPGSTRGRDDARGQMREEAAGETATRAEADAGAGGDADGRPAGSYDDDAPAATSASGRESRGKRQAAAKKKRPAKGTPLDFSGWCLTRFLELCVLSGCDFLPNVPSIGIKRAHALMCAHGSAAATLAALRAEKKVPVPEAYEAGFRRAFWTFRHARVYDPSQKRLRPLTPLPEELDAPSAETSFLGAHVEDAVAVEVAEGRLDPISRKPFVVPPSPQKQRGWAPRGGRGGRGGRGDAPQPLARPLAFANLFAAKAKRAGAAPAPFDDADALDDDAMALLMERVEKENGGGDAADAAGRGKRGTGGSGWVPATFSRAPSAAAGKTEPRDAAPARTSLPANVFARAAPAKKSAEISRLAGLFKRVEEKKHARAADSPPAPEAPEAAVPEPPAAPAAAAPPAASVPRGPMDAFAKLKAVYYADANKKRRRA